MKQKKHAVIIMNQWRPSPWDDLSYGMTGTIEPYGDTARLYFIFKPHGSKEQYVLHNKDFKLC